MRALEPQLPRECYLRAEQRRALEMLAAAGLYGCARATLLGHGFRSDMVADLVSGGLATESRETVKVGKRKFTVVRFFITDAGRRATKD